MRKTIEEKLAEFLGTKRWEKFKEEHQLEPKIKQDRSFLIERYKAKFQKENHSTIERVRL